MNRKKNLFWTTIIFHQSILWQVITKELQNTSFIENSCVFFMKRKFDDRFKLLDTLWKMKDISYKV